MKPIKDHSAKLKINLQSSTAHDGPPKNASLRPLKIPSYSILCHCALSVSSFFEIQIKILNLSDQINRTG